MLAANLIALLLEPRDHADPLGALVLEGLAAFELGKSETAPQAAISNATRYRRLAAKVKADGDGALSKLVIGRGLEALIQQVTALVLSGDPMTDWRAVRRLLDENQRDEIKAVGKEARHMRLLRRGAQIEGRLAEAWRSQGLLSQRSRASQCCRGGRSVCRNDARPSRRYGDDHPQSEGGRSSTR